jgi:hypothetical protein
MSSIRYRLRHFIFRWVEDEDGDIGLQFFGIVTFVKYKEHTLVYWFGNFKIADKFCEV